MAAHAPISAPWAVIQPMGWNSGDNFDNSIAEQQASQQVDAIAEKSKSHCWPNQVADIRWYQTTAKATIVSRAYELPMVGYSHLMSTTEEFLQTSQYCQPKT